MSAAVSERDASRGGARSRAELAPVAAEVTLRERAVTSWVPAMPSATARRARARATGTGGIGGA
jgi:hypothetical protein